MGICKILFICLQLQYINYIIYTDKLEIGNRVFKQCLKYIKMVVFYTIYIDRILYFEK